VNQAPTALQVAYWSRVAELGCLICRMPAQICHTHGARLTALGFHKPKGVKMAWMHWLVIPLCWHHHWQYDHRPRAFEAAHGDAVTLLARVMSKLGIDVYSRARALQKQPLLPRGALEGST
jgi:hypothetical protein